MHIRNMFGKVNIYVSDEAMKGLEEEDRKKKQEEKEEKEKRKLEQRECRKEKNFPKTMIFLGGVSIVIGIFQLVL